MSICDSGRDCDLRIIIWCITDKERVVWPVFRFLCRSCLARQLQVCNIVKFRMRCNHLAHTLNNTCVAPPRMLIAFLENNLQADGSVKIPEVLRPYMGGVEVLVPQYNSITAKK